jgi:alkaline phosphatase
MAKKQKENYVDGFVLVVPKKKILAYKKIAQGAAKVWRKYGAVDYKECVGDDLAPKWVTLTFPKMIKLKKGELVIFSYITYKSRAHRDKVNALVMKDPIMNDPKYKDLPMPFDMKRTAYAGFKVIVS